MTGVMRTHCRKKRCMIVGSYPLSLKNFRGALIESMLALGHEVHAVAPNLLDDTTTSAWLVERGVICHNVPMARTGLRVSADLKTLLSLINLINSVKPELFVGYTIKPVIWGLIASRFSNVPQRIALITGLGYAFTANVGLMRKLVGFVARSLYRVALKHATLVFFQNSDDHLEFLSLNLLQPRTPTEVVAGSGVNIQHFSAEPFPISPIRFLLIARLLGDKGIREYAAAAYQIRQSWPDVQFHLVGSTDPNPSGIPESEVAEWHASGTVCWHGQLSDVRKILAETHVYVLPSYREGTPRTVLEAMATGRAIITTDAPGCRETVQEGVNGFLVPVRDVAALANAMEKFILEPSLVDSMGHESRRIAIDKYDVNKVNSAMINSMGLS